MGDPLEDMFISAVRSRIQRPVLQSLWASSSRAMSAEKQYLATHEFIALDSTGKAGTVGITEYAQDSLGEIVSLKAASDLFMPVTGKVLAVNSILEDEPTLINDDPEGAGWILKVEVQEVDAELLLDDEQYDQLCLKEKGQK